ncbi:MAG TPA: hypothetical protein VMH78_03345 [Thermoplasmata archaeon]|nr:hypothetical protein [Thermoplasmata archaeon]
MRTYVRTIFHSEGADPLTLLEVMRGLGFEQSMGLHDFVYSWKERAGLDDVLKLVSEMHRRMKGLDVHYEVTTVT